MLRSDNGQTWREHITPADDTPLKDTPTNPSGGILGQHIRIVRPGPAGPGWPVHTSAADTNRPSGFCAAALRVLPVRPSVCPVRAY